MVTHYSNSDEANENRAADKISRESKTGEILKIFADKFPGFNKRDRPIKLRFMDRFDLDKEYDLTREEAKDLMREAANN